MAGAALLGSVVALPGAQVAVTAPSGSTVTSVATVTEGRALAATRDGMVFAAEDGTLGLVSVKGGAGVRLTLGAEDVAQAWGCGSSFVGVTTTEVAKDWSSSVLWVDTATGQSQRVALAGAERVIGASPRGYVVSSAATGNTVEVQGGSGLRTTVAPASDTWACDETGYAWTQSTPGVLTERAYHRTWASPGAAPTVLVESLLNLRLLSLDQGVALLSESKRDGYTTRPTAVSLVRGAPGAAPVTLWSGTDAVLDGAVTSGANTYLRVTDRTGASPTTRTLVREASGSVRVLTVPDTAPSSAAPLSRSADSGAVIGLGGAQPGLYVLGAGVVQRVATWTLVTRDGFTPVTPVRLADTRRNLGWVGRLPAGQVLRMRTGPASGVPVDAAGVLMRVTISGSSSAGFIRTKADGGAISGVGSIAFPLARPTTVEYLAPLDGTRLTELIGSATTHVAVDLVGFFSGAATHVPAPVRALDTIVAGDAIERVPAGGSVVVPLVGRFGLPTTGIESVVIALTIRWPSTEGYATVHPDGTPRPGASHLLNRLGESATALVTVPMTDSGAIRVYSWSAADVVVDVLGWHATGSDQVTLNPVTVMDTTLSATLPPGEFRKVQVAGVAGLPTTGIRAVRMMVLTSWPPTVGEITLSPTGERYANASTSFDAGHKSLAYVTLPVASDGSVEVVTNARTSLLLRVNGYWRS